MAGTSQAVEQSASSIETSHDFGNTNSLLGFMDSIRKTKCESKKIDLLRGAVVTLRNVNCALVRGSMQTTTLSPLFKEVVQFAIPEEFADRGHFIFEEDDFIMLREKTEAVLKFLHVFFDVCCQCGATETKPVDECLPLLVVVISSNIRNNLWSKDAVQKLTLLVLNQLTILYKVDSLSELLLLDLKSKGKEAITVTPTNCLLGQYLNVLKARLSKQNWQANPTFVESFYWTLTQMMKFPQLSNYLDVVLPPSLMLVDSHVTNHKVMGIQCLQHIAANVTKEELRWYGRAEVMYTALKQQIYTREPDIINVLHPALLTVLPIIDKDPAKPTTQTSPKHIDAIFSIIITNAITENGIVLRRMYTQCIAEFVDTLGVCVVRHLGQLVSLVSDYLEVFDGPEEQARLNTLNILRALLRNAWPRIPPHSEVIVKSIMKLIQDVVCDRTTTPESVKNRLKQEAVMCLGFLKEVFPDAELSVKAVCNSSELSNVASVVQKVCKGLD